MGYKPLGGDSLLPMSALISQRAWLILKQMGRELVRIATVATLLCLSIIGHSAASEARAVIKQPTNIQPQNLGAALRSLAKERNFQVVFASRDVAKLRTQGAVGSLTDDEALTQVLDGTGLVFRYLDEKTVTIVVDGEQDSSAGLHFDRTTWRPDGTSWTRLAQLSGDDARNGAQEVSASDTLEEVITTSTSMLISVGKTPASVRETPQSVSIITRQRIEDQNLVTLEDVLKESPGLTSQMHGMGQQRFYSRGYEVSVIQLDGVPTRHSPWNVLTPDLVMYDRAEILRGADGLYSGAGSPGGTVNLVRKKPLNQFQLTGAAVLGSENHYRAEADVTGPLTESGKLRARLVGAYDDRDFFYDIGEERSITAYAALAYDLTDSTAITAGLEYRDADGIPYMYGMPRRADGSSLGLSRSTFLNPAWNQRNYRGVTTHIEVEQKLGSDWIARVTATRVDAQMKYKEGHLMWSSIGADGLSYPEGYLSKYDDLQSGVEALLSGTVSLFGRTHDLQLGANWQKHNYTWDDRPLDVGNQPLDVFHWDPYALAEPGNDQTLDRWLSFNEQRQRGAFARARVRLTDRLSLIGGGRVSWYESVYRDDPNVVKQNGEFTPFAAAVFDLNNSWSLYVSYARIFEPQSSLRYFSGEALPPKIGTNSEAGIKGELMDGKLNISLAAFQVDETNRAQLDPVNSPAGGQSFYVAVGEVRSEGFELEVNGTLTPQWSLFGGYTYNTTEYLRDRTFQGLDFSTFTPRHLAKFWTTFRPQALLGGKLSLAGGVTAQSEQYNLQSGLKISQGGYAIVAARIGYQFSDKVQFALNADNLLDKHYYQNPGNLGGGVYYGAPRNFSVTVRAKY